MRTRWIHSYKRFWAAPEEKYAVEIRVYCSQEELNSIADAIRKSINPGGS